MIFTTVVSRLAELGYVATDIDNTAIRRNIDKAEAQLRAETNQREVPEGLFYVWVDMAAGLFLSDKKAAGALNDVYNFSAPAKSISEGNTSVTFAIAATGSFEEQLDAMLAKMTTPDPDLIIAYRRLVW